MRSKRRAYVKEVIISEEGVGRGEVGSPYRILTVVRDKDGKVIAEHDPLTENIEERPELHKDIQELVLDAINRHISMTKIIKGPEQSNEAIAYDVADEIFKKLFSFGD